MPKVTTIYPKCHIPNRVCSKQNVAASRTGLSWCDAGSPMNRFKKYFKNF